MGLLDFINLISFFSLYLILQRHPLVYCSDHASLYDSRERNKSHARNTRERKKMYLCAFKARLAEVEEESAKLKTQVDARYTACVLLGMGQLMPESSQSKSSTPAEPIEIRTSASICAGVMNKANNVSSMSSTASTDGDDAGDDVIDDEDDDNGSVNAANITDATNDATVGEKRARRRAKYSSAEREVIRRERNRVHAKKTRDKKKLFLESAEKTVETLELGIKAMREYLCSIGAMSVAQCKLREEGDECARLALKAMKGPNNGSGVHNTDIVSQPLVSNLLTEDSSNDVIDLLPGEDDYGRQLLLKIRGGEDDSGRSGSITGESITSSSGVTDSSCSPSSGRDSPC